MTDEQDKRPTRLRIIVPILLRWSPAILAAAVLGGLIVWWALASPTSSFSARQRMALQNQASSDLAASHERNAAWLDANRDELLAGAGEAATVELEQDADLRITGFAIIATADEEATALAVATTTADRLVEDQGGYRPVSVDARAVLEAQLADLRVAIAQREADATRLRVQREQLIEADGSSAEQDALKENIEILDIERAEYTRDALRTEDELNRLDVQDLSLQSIIETIGDPTATADIEPDVRARAAVFAMFIAGSIAAALVLLGHARRGSVRSADHARYGLPDTPVVDFTGQPGVPPDWAELGVLADRLRRSHTELATIVVVPADEATSTLAVATELRALTNEPAMAATIIEESVEGGAAPVARANHVVLVATRGQTGMRQLRASRRRFTRYPLGSVSIALIDHDTSSPTVAPPSTSGSPRPDRTADRQLQR